MDVGAYLGTTWCFIVINVQSFFQSINQSSGLHWSLETPECLFLHETMYVEHYIPDVTHLNPNPTFHILRDLLVLELMALWSFE
jgi:hypothetical protein